MNKPILLVLLSFFLCVSCINRNFYYADYLAMVQDRVEEPEIVELTPPMEFFKASHMDGSFHALGVQIGILAGERGVSPRRIPRKDREFNQSIIDMYARVYPQQLELLRGIGEKFSMDVEDMDLRYMEMAFFQDLHGSLGLYQGIYNEYPHYEEELSSGACSTLVYNLGSPEESHMVAGRNFDIIYPAFIQRSTLEGVYASLAVAEGIFHQGIDDGINQHGLFISVMDMSEEDYVAVNVTGEYPEVPSIHNHHMMRIVLDTCATLEEALELYRTVNLWFDSYLNHFLIADAQGNACMVEYNLEGEPQFTYMEGSYLLSTNTPLIEEERLEKCWRFNQVSNQLEENTLENAEQVFDQMMTIAIYPGNPYLMEVLSPEEWEETNRLLGEVALTRYRTGWITLYDLNQRTLTAHFFEDNYSHSYPFRLSPAE